MNIDPEETVRFGDLGPPLTNVTIEARGEVGELWVKSPTISPAGYDNRPELNATVFRDGFYNSGDLGRIDARGHLWMTGRKQSFVDIGGRKVDLGEVEEVLLSHPNVREAAAVGVEIAGMGLTLKAVLAAAESCRESDILDHCRRSLAPFKVPRLIEFRETLPRSPLGKVLKSELMETADWLADVPSARDIPPGSLASRTAWLARRIQQQVAAILACPPNEIARDAPFQALGFDSLHVVELQERLSRMSGVALSIATLWNHPSIDGYAAFLLDAMAGPEPAAPSVVRDELDDIPDDEIAAMLARELAPGGEAT
jgi:long-chain acyl-CoA synthetase